MTNINLWTALAIALAALTLYFFPFLVAWVRHHRQIAAIFWTKFFFGWAGIGWCISFIWAVIR